MRLVGHLVRADIRHFRWSILLWAVLVAAETGVVAIRPAFMADMRLYGNVGMIGGLLWSALQIGMLLIVPLIVQAHPAVGTDAFWMTRPIPPRALLASKLVLLAAMTVLLSCAARLALMLWIHVPIREALLVILDMAISSSAWLAVLMAGATVTLNLPRFALLCGGVMISFVLLTTMLLMRMRIGEGTATATLMIGGSGQPVLPPAEDPTQAIVFLLCAAAVARAGARPAVRRRRGICPGGDSVPNAATPGVRARGRRRAGAGDVRAPALAVPAAQGPIRVARLDQRRTAARRLARDRDESGDGVVRFRRCR